MAEDRGLETTCLGHRRDVDQETLSRVRRLRLKDLAPLAEKPGRVGLEVGLLAAPQIQHDAPLGVCDQAQDAVQRLGRARALERPGVAAEREDRLPTGIAAPRVIAAAAQEKQ